MEIGVTIATTIPGAKEQSVASKVARRVSTTNRGWEQTCGIAFDRDRGADIKR